MLSQVLAIFSNQNFFPVLPYIDAKSLRDMTVEVKDRLRFDVPIFGEPAPEVCWYKEDQTVEELGDRNISVMNTDGHTKIVINNITKAQAGKYSLIIKNRYAVQKFQNDTLKIYIKLSQKIYTCQR